MSIPTFNIGGLASGLDTNSIVSQLVQLERIPVTQIQQRQALYQRRVDAWGRINTAVDKLHTATKAIDGTADWQKFVSVASSNESAVGVSISGTPPASATSFTVGRLATSHQMVDGGAFTSSADLVGAGTFSITVGGTQHDITTTASTTLSDLRNQINALDIGVTASVLTVDTDDVRLSLSADTTGDASEFSVANDQVSLGTFSILQQGYDAQITLGSGAGAITVERATNTVTDLIQGVTLDLKQTTAAAVTVTVNDDIDASVTAVTDMVKALNAALDTIGKESKTSSESGASGPLALDSTVRTLQGRLRGALSGAVNAGSAYPTASSVGITFGRDGRYVVDETKLRDALEADPTAVQELFLRATSATDGRVTVTRATSTAFDGTHAVQITQAAERATATGTPYVAPSLDENFTITVGADVANVTITALSDIDSAIAQIEAALEAAGIIDLAVSNNGGAIEISHNRYGAANDFSVSANGLGLAGTFSGADVAGTINGIAATGSGQSLTGTGDLDGLLLTITASAAEVAGAGGTLGLGSVTISSGLAATFEEYLDSITGTGGNIDRAQERWENAISDADDRIEDLERRIELREVFLRRQYAALESSMAQLTGLSSQLAAGLSGLGGGQR